MHGMENVIFFVALRPSDVHTPISLLHAVTGALEKRTIHHEAPVSQKSSKQERTDFCGDKLRR